MNRNERFYYEIVTELRVVVTVPVLVAIPFISISVPAEAQYVSAESVVIGSVPIAIAPAVAVPITVPVTVPALSSHDVKEQYRCCENVITCSIEDKEEKADRQCEYGGCYAKI